MGSPIACEWSFGAHKWFFFCFFSIRYVRIEFEVFSHHTILTPRVHITCTCILDDSWEDKWERRIESSCSFPLGYFLQWWILANLNTTSTTADFVDANAGGHKLCTYLNTPQIEWRCSPSAYTCDTEGWRFSALQRPQNKSMSLLWRGNQYSSFTTSMPPPSAIPLNERLDCCFGRWHLAYLETSVDEYSWLKHFKMNTPCHQCK